MDKNTYFPNKISVAASKNAKKKIKNKKIGIYHSLESQVFD